MKSTRVVKLLCVSSVLLFISGSASAQDTKPAASVPKPVWPAASQPSKNPSAPAMGADAYPMIRCTQGHPGESQRARDVTFKGDARMARSVANHVVTYSVQRFRLTGKVQPQDVSRASDNLYEHLKWKLGNPTAIAGQFVTAGYEHFDNSYSWEAAAALLGGSLPSEKDGPEFKIPRKYAEILHKWAEDAGKRLENYLETQWSIPPQLSEKIVIQLEGAANKSIEHLGINMPKNWNMDHNLVAALLAAKQSDQSKQLPTSAAKPRR